MADERQTWPPKVNEKGGALLSSNLLYGVAGATDFEGRQPFNLTEYVYGEVAEWSNAADSKSVVPLVGTGSSNLPLSAINSRDEKNDRYGRQPASVRWPSGHDVRRTVPNNVRNA